MLLILDQFVSTPRGGSGAERAGETVAPKAAVVLSTPTASAVPSLHDTEDIRGYLAYVRGGLIDNVLLSRRTSQHECIAANYE